MRQTRLLSNAMTQQAAVKKMRDDVRRFVNALAARLVELERMAKAAKRFEVFSAEEYSEFKLLFRQFRELSEEFQMLSHLAEASLGDVERWGNSHPTEFEDLEAYFRKLQIPMLHALISTNLRLLKVWDDRLQRGEGLPYGARELFIETIRIIHHARIELLRPRYVALLDDAALRNADRAERLLRTLIEQAPALVDFGSERPWHFLDDEEVPKLQKMDMLDGQIQAFPQP